MKIGRWVVWLVFPFILIAYLISSPIIISFNFLHFWNDVKEEFYAFLDRNEK